MTAPPIPAVSSPIAEGRYDVHELIGRGSTARVHRGHDLVLHRDVAVKLVPAPDAHAAERWWAREVGLRARLDPGQVPALFDCGRADDDTAFVVLQLALGGTLTDRLRPGPLGLDDAVGLTCTLADSLRRMHAHGVRHGDVSVDAVLSDGRGAPLWCGFAPAPSPGPVADDAEGLARLALSCLEGTGSAEDAEAVRVVLTDVVHGGDAAAAHADRLRDVLLTATRGTGASRRRPGLAVAGRFGLGGARVRSGTGHRRRGAMAAASLATVAAVGLGVVGLAEAVSAQPLEVAAATLAPAPSVPAAPGTTSGRSTPTSVAPAMARTGSGHEGGTGSGSSPDDRSSRTGADDAAALSSPGHSSAGRSPDEGSPDTSDPTSSGGTGSRGAVGAGSSDEGSTSARPGSDSDDSSDAGTDTSGRAGSENSGSHRDSSGHGRSGALPAVRSAAVRAVAARALAGQAV